jgi:hypothetical protein
MNLSVESITEISRAVAHEHDGDLHIVGVTATDGGTDRAEILVTIGGCHHEPCRFLVNVTRADREQLEEELTQKLDDALRKHLAAPAP